MTEQVVIIGGGAIGSAVAYFLASDPGFAGRVTVVERDPSYRIASSALSASSIRQQFSTPINIALSQFGIAFLREIGTRLAVDGDAPDIGLTEPGYLYLATRAGLPALEANHRIQKTHGVAALLLSPAVLRARFPWLATDGVAGASLGLRGEGWFDGYSLLQALRRKARALGVAYRQAEVTGLGRRADRIESVQLDDGERLDCDRVVDAAGPWAARIAAMAGIDLPVRARRRCVFVVACRTSLPDCPLVIDTSGVWFRPEGARDGGGQFICGVSPPAHDDPDDAPLEVDHALFEQVIWPALAARVPAFEALKQVGAWAGYYEFNMIDQNGIVGPHPAVTNLIFANGFSGHGIQQAPGVGRAVAELIVHGAYRSLDLTPLAFDRLLARPPLRELNII